ncbi:MAG: GspE/PulE family protein, partial [Bacteriovorax sp.]
MFRKEFIDVITKTGMVPIKDLRPLTLDKDPLIISELGLLQLKFFDNERFARQVAENHNLMYIDLSRAKISARMLRLIKKSDIIKYRVIPVRKDATAVCLAIYDPSIIQFKIELQTHYQYPIEFFLTSLSAWADLFAHVPESVDDILDTIREIKTDAKKEESIKEEDIGDDVIKYVNRILAEAFITKCSDIHIEPYENNFRIRYRQDGSLIEASRPPKNFMLPIISRVKILAQMDISERRKPQDGRIKLEIGGRPIDYRVSSLPTLFGEKIVLRLLDSSNLQLDMTKLGFE